MRERGFLSCGREIDDDHVSAMPGGGDGGSCASGGVTASLTSPAKLIDRLPLQPDETAAVAASRAALRRILDGTDDRLALFVGPCSAHDVDAVLSYGQRLRELTESVIDDVFVVMRAYAEKSRTAIGWPGLVYDPELDGTFDVEGGLWLARSLMRELTRLRTDRTARS